MPDVTDLTGEFEIHLTVDGRDAEALDGFAQEHGVGFVHIVLDRGDHSSQPMLTLTSSGPLARQHELADRWAGRLRAAGLPPVRTKIEATQAPGVVQPGVFDPAHKQWINAYRAGEPQFADPGVRARWQAARRAAMGHVLSVIADGPAAGQLVLRGSVLMPVWCGDQARDPGDLDFVVTSPAPERGSLLDGVVSGLRASPARGSTRTPRPVPRSGPTDYAWSSRSPRRTCHPARCSSTSCSASTCRSRRSR